MAKKNVCLCIDYYVSCGYCPYKYRCEYVGKTRKELLKIKLIKKPIKKEGTIKNGKKRRS